MTSSGLSTMVVGSVVLAACGGAATSGPVANTSNGPAPAASVAKISDDLCEVLETVRAAAASEFESLRGAKADSGNWTSTVKPRDAERALVRTPIPVETPWTWEVMWRTNDAPGAPPVERIQALRNRLRACAVAADLTGPTEPHQSERNGTPNAIEWKLPAARLSLSVLAEPGSVVLDVSPMW